MAHRIGKIQKSRVHQAPIAVTSSAKINLHGSGSALTYDGTGMHHHVLLEVIGGGTVTLEGSNSTGVILDAGAVTAASMSSGQLTINGTNIGAVTILANDTSKAFRNAINAQSTTTGVIAYLDGLNHLKLQSLSGANIVIDGTASGTGSSLSNGTTAASDMIFVPVATATAIGVLSTGDLNSPAYKYYRVGSTHNSEFTVVSFSSLIPSP